MKILIIGHHRSGTTSLQKALTQGLNNCKSLFEPYNDPNFIKNHNNYLQFLTNTSSHVVEKNLIVSPFGVFEENISFYLKYINNFDKIILLYRKDIVSTAQSYRHHILAKEKDIKKEGTIHYPYYFDYTMDISKDIQIVKNWHYTLNILSNKTKIPLISYEDIYSGNIEFIKSFLKIYNIELDNQGIFYNILSPKNRYRQN